MRTEHCTTGMWTVLSGAAFWVVGFVLLFVIPSGQGLAETVGTVMLIAGIILILVGGQIIRMTISGESIQPTTDVEKIRVLVCANCSEENPDDAKFCLGCGKRIKREK